MDTMHTTRAKDFNEQAYKEYGFSAQRRYPNEELCRFMGRNFFNKEISHQERKAIKILETGCGSGANLWMIAREGFDAYGIDISPTGISLAKRMLEGHGVSARFSVQDMTSLDFPDSFFDVVIDVFSSCHLNKQQGVHYLSCVRNILKPNGLFFSYFPSKKSDAYQFPDSAEFIDSDTLQSIKRKGAPFSPSDCPFRFMHPMEYKKYLKNIGFTVQYLETIERTYCNQREKFIHIVVEARK